VLLAQLQSDYGGDITLLTSWWRNRMDLLS
jgi:hypothetical protein